MARGSRRGGSWPFGALLALWLMACGGGGAVQEPAARPAVEGRSDEADAPAAVADLQSMRGDVRKRAASSVDWVTARNGMELSFRDSVQTMSDSTASISFRAGGTLAMEPDTTLRIPEQPPETTRLVHVHGQMTARLVPTDGPQRIELQLPPGELILESDGTEESTVEADVTVNEEQETHVHIARGSGVLRRRGHDELELDSDRFVQLDSAGEVVEEGVSNSAPEPVLPANGESILTRRGVAFTWQGCSGADSYLVQLEDESGHVATFSAPENERAIELPSGTYSWQVRARFEGGMGPSSTPRQLTVTLDRQPPTLRISTPTEGSPVTSPSVRVRGSTEAGASLRINGANVAVEEDGSFDHVVRLSVGLTNLVLQARDEAGNARTLTRTVLRSR